MKILTAWLRASLPALPVSDRQLAEDLTLRGIAVEGVHDLGTSASGGSNGHLFEMDITTNRVDAMNHFGIAREAATIYDLPLLPLAAGLPAGSPAPPFPVRIDPAAQHLCGRFTARVLRDVTVAPSTGQVREFFSLLGQKPISNAVDASNFTLLGMGHPTHAFDLDRIEGGIVVRLAHPGEKLRLLDGTERTLEPDDLVIADQRKALSLAGVMGGFESSISPATKNILVESAWFEPPAIRRSSRRHLLHTDASHRFERGADFNAAPLANDLVSDLILRSGGGRLEGELVDVVVAELRDRTAARPQIRLSVREVQRHLGATLDDAPGHSALSSELVVRYLTALGCTLTPAAESSQRVSLHARQDTSPDAVFSVTLPSWRLDLEREIDLIEEVARVFGYNRFANTLPAPRPVLAHGSSRGERAIRARLLALGFSEAISSTFAPAAAAELFAPDNAASANPPRHHVPLENPLSEEASLLRPSLLPGMLSMLAGNLNRDGNEVRLFEAGEVFAGTTSAGSGAIADVLETESLALGLTTASAKATPLHSADDAPLFELKGIVEALVSLFDLPGGSESPASITTPGALSFTTAGTPAWLEQGRSGTALLYAQPLAYFGEFARDEAARRKLRQPVFLATVDLATLLALPLRKHTAHELSRFQAAERDFSFVFPDTTEWHTVAATVRSLALADLQSLAPVEIFRDPRGKTIPTGHYSLLLRTVFQSATRTLAEDELSATHAAIIAALESLGGIHRR